MPRDLFRDRHPLGYASLHHAKNMAILAVVCMVFLEIGTFVCLIHARLKRETCVLVARPIQR